MHNESINRLPLGYYLAPSIFLRSISGFFAYVSWWRGMAALRRRLTGATR
ncbi:MAG: hypothetical protein AAFS02_11350 [Pseudomonadota bacterium]